MNTQHLRILELEREVAEFILEVLIDRHPNEMLSAIEDATDNKDDCYSFTFNVDPRLIRYLEDVLLIENSITNSNVDYGPRGFCRILAGERSNLEAVFPTRGMFRDTDGVYLFDGAIRLAHGANDPKVLIRVFQ